MPTEPEKQWLASVVARWLLLVPLSFASGVAVALVGNAVLGPSPAHSSDPWAVVPAALSTALAAITYLAVAHSIAPFWKPAVVIALAGLLVILNLAGAMSAAWSLLIHHGRPQDRIGLAETVGFLGGAFAASALFLRKPRPPRATT